MSTRFALFREKIGHQIVALALIPALLTAALAAAGGFAALDTLKERRIAAEMDAAGLRVDAELRAAEIRMQALAESFALRRDLAEAAAAGDAPAVQRELTAAFARLRESDSTLAVLEATDAQGRVLARGHQPGRSGDDKSRVADVAAALRGRAAAGAIVSPTSGEIAVGTAVPVRLEGRVVGTVKAAVRLDAASANAGAARRCSSRASG